MTAVNFIMPFRPAFESNSLPIAGAKAYIYLSGTTTLANVYSDSALTVLAANPIVANGSGRFPQRFLNSATALRLYITNASGVPTGEDYDPYTPATPVDFPTSPLVLAQGTLAAPSFAVDISATWNNMFAQFGVIRMRINATATDNYAHSFIDALTTTGDGMQALTRGEIILRNGGGQAGIACANGGTGYLTSGPDTPTGNPGSAKLLGYNWGGGPIGGAAILTGSGTTRLHINAGSGVALVCEAGRHEREVSASLGTTIVPYVFYVASSAIGATHETNASGQSPTRANPTSATRTRHDEPTFFAQVWGTLNEGTNTRVNNASIRGNGEALVQSIDVAVVTPGNPAAGFVRLYGKNVAGVIHWAMRDSAGNETVF